MKYIYLLLAALILSACPSIVGTIDLGLNTVPESVQSGGTTYYLSNEGSDSNSGTSESSPWATIDKLNSDISVFKPGDSILFKRGDTFRGFLEPSRGSETNWIRYSTYGSGEKPRLIGSVDLGSEAAWNSTSTANVWKSTQSFDLDIGGIFFNGDYSTVGERKWSIVTLGVVGDFYFDYTLDDKYIYLYASKNPGLAFTGIEASQKTNIVTLDERSYLLFEGLHLSLGAAHGFGGAKSQSIIIRGCDFSYIGGGYLHTKDGDPVRYGNGVEFWGNTANNLVENSRFWEIYDTAVTNQCHELNITQRNIYYINNIIWNCGLASFELWNRSTTSSMEYIYFINNTSVDPGFGWGGTAHRSDKNSFHIASFSNQAAGENLVIKNNIFYSSATPAGTDYHLFFLDEDVNNGYKKYLIDNNLWYMPVPAWGVGIDADSSFYNSFAAWQRVNNQSQHGINADPLFTDFSSQDFSLQSTSPAIDKGAITVRDSDFNDYPNLGLADMGAIEFY